MIVFATSRRNYCSRLLGTGEALVADFFNVLIGCFTFFSMKVLRWLMQPVITWYCMHTLAQMICAYGFKGDVLIGDWKVLRNFALFDVQNTKGNFVLVNAYWSSFVCKTQTAQVTLGIV